MLSMTHDNGSDIITITDFLKVISEIIITFILELKYKLKFKGVRELKFYFIYL